MLQNNIDIIHTNKILKEIESIPTKEYFELIASDKYNPIRQHFDHDGVKLSPIESMQLSLQNSSSKYVVHHWEAMKLNYSVDESCKAMNISNPSTIGFSKLMGDLDTYYPLDLMTDDKGQSLIKKILDIQNQNIPMSISKHNDNIKNDSIYFKADQILNSYLSQKKLSLKEFPLENYQAIKDNISIEDYRNKVISLPSKSSYKNPIEYYSDAFLAIGKYEFLNAQQQTNDFSTHGELQSDIFKTIDAYKTIKSIDRELAFGAANRTKDLLSLSSGFDPIESNFFNDKKYSNSSKLETISNLVAIKTYEITHSNIYQNFVKNIDNLLTTDEKKKIEQIEQQQTISKQATKSIKI